MDCLHVRPAPAKISPPIDPPPRPGGPFAAFYRAHKSFVRAVLLGKGVSEANADDLTQDVFTVAFRRGVIPPDASQSRSWLSVIASHLAWNHRTRKGYARESSVGEIPERAEYSRICESIDAARWIRRAIERLSPKLRVVFVAAEVEGRAMEAIARELGIKLKTAWARLRLARMEVLRWAGGRVSVEA